MKQLTFKYFLLNEAREDDIAARNSDKILRIYQTDIKTHPGSPKNFTTPLEIIQYISFNTNPKLIVWTANQYLKRAFSLEDVEMIKHDFELFNKLKSILTKKDIGQYQSVTELRDVLEQNKSQLGKKQSTINKESSIQKYVDSGQAETMYNKNGFLIVWTKTHTANCAIGSGTKWCTTSSDPELFDMYNKNSPIYILFTPDKQKYQFNEGALQFMNSRDESAISILLGEKNVLFRYPTLIPIIQQVLHSKDWINETILENTKGFIGVLKRVSQDNVSHDDIIKLCNYMGKAYDENADSWNDDLYWHTIEELKKMNASNPIQLLLQIAITGVKNDIYSTLWSIILYNSYEEDEYHEIYDKVYELAWS